MTLDPSDLTEQLAKAREALDRAALSNNSEQAFRREVLSLLGEIRDAVVYLKDRKVEEMKRNLPQPIDIGHGVR